MVNGAKLYEYLEKKDHRVTQDPNKTYGMTFAADGTPTDGETAKKIVITFIIWFFGVVMIIPFIWMLSTSFKGMNDVFTFPIEWIPSKPTLKGYQALFSGTIPFFQYFFNSVKVSVIALIGTLFSCTMAGYAYAKVRFVARDQLFKMKLMTTMLPGMVTMLPTYIIYSKLGLLNTHASLWIG